jgi:hypothetical protein
MSVLMCLIYLENIKIIDKKNFSKYLFLGLGIYVCTGYQTYEFNEYFI